MPVLAEGQKKLIQPLSALDFADGILASLTRQNAIGKTYLISSILLSCFRLWQDMC
jgi:hypothetical protein